MPHIVIYLTMGQSGCLIGKKYGKLFISKALGTEYRNSKTYRIYECICDCGKIIELSSRLINSRRKSCGCAKQDEAIKRRRGSSKEYTARNIWRNHYKDGCSFEKFMDLSQKECHYCGSPPSNYTSSVNKKNSSKEWYDTSFFTYNGLDRIDSSKDHNENNIVACCKKCNWMKNKSNYDDFIDHIKKIVKHLKINNVT